MSRTPVPRAARPTAAEFAASYLEPGQPVVITDVATAWPACTTWTLAFFRQHFGRVPVPLRGSDKELEVFFGRVGPRQLLVNEYFDLLERQQPGERLPYLGNLSFADPLARPLLAPLEAHFTFPAYFDTLPRREMRLWIGGPGQTSTIHNDTYHNLNAQIQGRKTFVLFAPAEYPHLYTTRINSHCWASKVDPEAPDRSAYPRYERARALEVTLGPGEILFIPKFWWHYVRAETTAVNVNMWAFTADEAVWAQPDLATVSA